MFSDKDDDDMIYLIQSEAKNLVDSVLEESVVAVTSDKSALGQTSSVRFENDEQLISFELSNDESSISQQNFQLQLNNNSSNYPSDQAHLSELSDNFAIKCDYDVIMKSPTIESGMSGKDFDDDYNFNSSSLNNIYVSSNENTSTVTQNISVSQNVHGGVVNVNESNVLAAAEDVSSSVLIEQNIQNEAKNLVDSVIKDTINHFDERSSDDVNQLSSSEIKQMLILQGENSFRHEHNK